MSHGVRIQLGTALKLANETRRSWCALPRWLPGLLSLLFVGCCSFSSRAGDEFEGSGSLVANATLSLSIPDSLPSLPPSLPAAESERATSNADDVRAEHRAESEPDNSAWQAPRPRLEAVPDLSLMNGREIENFLKTTPHESRFGAEEFVLFRHRMPSRYAYNGWANFNTGYGRFFPDEAIARSRTSGAGVEDPDWVYIKVTFQF